MRVLFLFNGMSHYFNLITSQINKQPGVEVLYVYPKGLSGAVGDGVYQTQKGADFKYFELQERKNDKYFYFEGLEEFIQVHRPDIILDTGTYLNYLLEDKNISALIKSQNIKVILKTIPFNTKKYQEEIADFKLRRKKMYPVFDFLPFFIRSLIRVSRLDLIYKFLVYDKKLLEAFLPGLESTKRIYNSVDAHVNYIEDAYEIYGSYGVQREKVFITYNSPDTDVYFSVKEKLIKENISVGNYRIVHLSRLVQWKRVDMLITAVSNLKKEYPEIELLVLGDGSEKENLIKQAKSLGVESNVRFIGGVYETELLGRYLMSSSMYVLAGMGGLSINDAMIFGLPVICSVCDGTEKYLVKEGRNGLYFQKDDQVDLEKKIRYLLDNPIIRNQMGQESVRIIKEEINISTVVKGYLDAFNYVLKDSLKK